MAGLAARCTACSTVFRVVPDQLRVAGGFVRCGRCSAVFNAAQALVDVDSLGAHTQTPAPSAQEAAAPAVPAEAVADLASVEASPSVAAIEPPAWEPPLPAPSDDAPHTVPAVIAEPAANESEAPREFAAALPLDRVEIETVGLVEAADAASHPAPEFADGAAPAPAPAPGTVTAPAPEDGTDFQLDLVAPTPLAASSESEAGTDSAPPLPVATAAPGEDFELELPQSETRIAAEPAALAPEADFDLDTSTAPADGARDWVAQEPVHGHAHEPAHEAADAAAEELVPMRIDYDPRAAAQPLSIELSLPPASPDAAPQRLALETALAQASPAPSEAPAAPAQAPEPLAPSFVRRAERAARWNAPRMRAGLAVACVAGLLLLAGQVVYGYRDLIVARWPDTRALVEPVCAALACRVEAPRSIESLVIESSGLVRVEKSSVYKLQLALRNRSALDVTLPALDLTLSDAQGKPLARRVLRATDLGVNTATLAAGREVALQATLQARFADGASVAGYTIDPFYP